jgi:hypothetical protein
VVVVVESQMMNPLRLGSDRDCGLFRGLVVLNVGVSG